VVRHFRMPENIDRPKNTVALEAVSEVGNPTILATFTVIAAILPMAFVGGLMGPYMRPIPVGASAAMIFSLLIAFIVTPWASIHLLKKGHVQKVTGIFFRSPPMFQISCSWCRAIITEPAPRNNRALKNACVVR